MFPALPTVRKLLHHAVPILIAQLAVMGMMVADTILVGHFSAVHLAAVAIGSGLYISVVFALAGVIQAVSPIVAHHYGAGRDREIATTLHQAVWLALVLSVPGALLLLYPTPLLALSTIPPEVETVCRQYLAAMAAAIPASLLNRAFQGFANAMGKPRVLMLINLLALAVYLPLVAWLIRGGLGVPALGALGCALAAATISWMNLCIATTYLWRAPFFRTYRLFSGWSRPHWPTLAELGRLGLPMGFSNFVEITSFTLISLFVARLGAEVIAGHRIVANVAAVSYMLPLSLAIATLVLVGQAAGGQAWPRARHNALTGMAVAAAACSALGLGLWLTAEPLVRLYTNDTRVGAIALALLPYIAVYQLFDAVQTVAGQALRGYKVSFAPMLAHITCFWGIGLGGGYWLTYRGWDLGPWRTPPMGVAGFWLASVVATIAISVLLGGLLLRVIRQHAERD